MQFHQVSQSDRLTTHVESLVRIQHSQTAAVNVTNKGNLVHLMNGHIQAFELVLLRDKYGIELTGQNRYVLIQVLERVDNVALRGTQALRRCSISRQREVAAVLRKLLDGLMILTKLMNCLGDVLHNL